jgi:acetoacetate decarboxylase
MQNSEKMATFRLLDEKAVLNPLAVMGDQVGLYFSFVTDFSTLAQIIPPPLELLNPVVSGYITHIRKPSFSEEYHEAMLGVFVKFGDIVGIYPISFLLSGPGAEMATYLGRDKTGLPKKMCESDDCIQLSQNGDVVRGIVERKGIRLMDVSIKLGAYNNPIADQIYLSPTAGKKTNGYSFYYTTYMQPDANGNAQFCNVNLLSNLAEYTYYDWTPGTVSARLQSSSNDPWGQLPVLEMLGGGFSNNDLEMKELKVMATPNAEEVMPYLLSTRFDKSGLI